jgi:uncharacterized repeat protein (TIGR03803 family)
MPEESSGNYAALHHFSGWDGASPGGIVIDANGTDIYGATAAGGAYDQGVIFRLNDHGYTLLRSCDMANGSVPAQGVALSADGRLYGLALQGGLLGAGSAYSLLSNGSVFALVASFGGANGSAPVAQATLSDDGWLFCALGQSGERGFGTLISINTDNGDVTVLHQFQGGSDGALPYSPLTMSEDGLTLYGMTYSGGSGYGTVFSIGVDGTGYQVLHAFAGSDGAYPQLGGLCLDSHGTLYGTTSSGGLNGKGTVFSMHVDGSHFAVLHSFLGSDGSAPLSTLVYSNATHLFYGTASQGGQGSGTIYQMSGDGSNFTVLFNLSAPLGSLPTGPLVLDEKGSILYGTASAGGANGLGVVFGYRLSGGH